MKSVLNLKACPRCSGDLYIAGDIYGDYKECIQCGYMKDLGREPMIGVGVETPNKEAA